MNWATSDRHDRLPHDWAARVVKVKQRAHGQCEATHHANGCTGIGTDVDHVRQGDDHALANLQLLSPQCHARKTRLDNGYNAHVKAPVERHPGAL